MMHLDLSGGVLASSLQGLDLFAILGITAALVLGGMVKGLTGIGVPLVAMPILSQWLPIKQAVLLLSTYLIASGATGRTFTKQIAIILVVSIVTLVATFSGAAHASRADLAISTAASIPAIVGIRIVRPLRDTLSPRTFRVIVLLFVLAAAVLMIWKSGVLRTGG